MLSNINIINKNLLDKKIIILFFFIIYFIIGNVVVNDYGIPFDEDYQRIIAQNRLDYIANFFSNIFLLSTDALKNEIEIMWPEYGVVFELPALWLEKIIGFSDTRSQSFFKHYLIFLVSFIGSIFFYFIALKKFNSWKLALLGTLFLVSSPRIFAESFYNSKDIIFMYFFIINTFFAIIFLEKPNKFNSIMLSVVSALCIGVRVGGIILTIVVLYFLLIKYLRKDYNFKITNSVLTLFLSLTFFIILFWPSLWENPIYNFIHAMTSFSNYEHEMFNFYLGSFITANANYWYYIPLWICITTPLLIIIFFIYGFLLSIRRIFCRLIKIKNKVHLNDLWRGFSEFQDLIFIILFFVPIFFTIVFKSTLYTGWRHLYFIYPFIILIGLNALRIIYLKLNLIKAQNIKWILNFIISIFIIFNFYWMYKNHPFQNNYFNFFAGDKPHENFEVDYWGLSNKFVLEKILNEDDNQIISVSAISVTSLAHNFNILTEKQKKRIRYSKDLKSSDYIVNNNIFVWGDKNKLKKMPENFEVYYELFIDDILITTIYKRSG
jgi:hypothetical protein